MRKKSLRESVAPQAIRATLLKALKETTVESIRFKEFEIPNTRYSIDVLYPMGTDLAEDLNNAGYFDEENPNAEDYLRIESKVTVRLLDNTSTVLVYIDFPIAWEVQIIPGSDAQKLLNIDTSLMENDVEYVDNTKEYKTFDDNEIQEIVSTLEDELGELQSQKIIEMKIKQALKTVDINESRKPTSNTYKVILTENHVRVKNRLGRVILDVTGLRARSLFRESNGDATRLVKRVIK